MPPYPVAALYLRSSEPEPGGDPVPKASQDKTARALRVYEYVDEDGVVFWSFTYLPGRSFRRLALDNPRGTHFRQHISDVHKAAFQSELLDKEEGG